MLLTSLFTRGGFGVDGRQRKAGRVDAGERTENPVSSAFPRASKIDVRRRTLAISVRIHRLAIICEQSCDRSAAVPPRQRDTSTSKENWERDPHLSPSPPPLHIISIPIAANHGCIEELDTILAVLQLCWHDNFWSPVVSQDKKKNNAWSLKSSFVHGLQYTNKSLYFEVMDLLIFRKKNSKGQSVTSQLPMCFVSV